MKFKCSFCTLWLPTLISSFVTLFVFSFMYVFLNTTLNNMFETQKNSAKLTKDIETMVASTLNASFLENDEGFLETVVISNHIQDQILSMQKNDSYDVDSILKSYKELYKQLISAVSYTKENRLQEARKALEDVKHHADELNNNLERLNEYIAKEERSLRHSIYIMMAVSGMLLLFMALFNGFYLIPKRVIRPLEEYAQALRDKEEKYRIVADWTHDWEYWVGVDGKIVFVSPSVKRITGYTQEEFMQNASLLVDIIYKDDVHLWEEHVKEAHQPNRAEDDAQGVEFRVVTKDGATVYIDHICRPVYNYDGLYMGVRVANRDITQKMKILLELREKNALLNILATTDALSKLYNRRYFDDRFEIELENSKRNKTILSVVMCDIDYFKAYNDMYGHQKGDLVIQKVSHALKTTFSRSVDLVARYGGEEFVILLSGTPLHEVQNLANNAREAIVKLNIEHLASKTAPVVSMSFGIASCYWSVSMTTDSLLKRADDALYESKENGRNQVTVYKEALTQIAQ